jgi:intein-encoded DNA endonuclease-like protein
MPKYCSLAKNFFKSWSPEMAYVLGYIAADGTISISKRGNCYLMLEGIDKELISGIKRVLRSGHKMTSRRRSDKWNRIYRLQIGSKEMVGDLIDLGLTPNKSKRLSQPDVPKKYFGDFVRGYFDGDGNVCFARFKRLDRKHGHIQYIRVLFTSCSKMFLKGIALRLKKESGIDGFILRARASYYLLYCYKNEDIKKIFKLFYGRNPPLYLNRKFVYFKRALERISGGR